MTIAGWILAAIAVFFYFWQQRKDADLIVRLLERMDGIQQDNKALTEALVREQGKPLVFKPPEKVPSPGWFDPKEVVQITSEKS